MLLDLKKDTDCVEFSKQILVNKLYYFEWVVSRKYETEMRI